VTHATKYGLLDAYLKTHVGQLVSANQLVLEVKYPNSVHRKQTNLTAHAVGMWLHKQAKLGRVTAHRMMVPNPLWNGDYPRRRKVQRSVYKVIQ
jgi:hypothetical protein